MEKATGDTCSSDILRINLSAYQRRGSCSISRINERERRQGVILSHLYYSKVVFDVTNIRT